MHTDKKAIKTGIVDIENINKQLPRRDLMRMLALIGGSTIFGAEFANADLYERWVDRLRSGRRVRGVDVPADWVKVLGSRTLDYASYLHRLRLRNLTPEEIIRPHTNKRGSVQNTLPPMSMWRNIRSTLMVVDRISSMLREDVRAVTSVYRSPSYNRMCRGASRDSYHMRNNAIDIKFTTSPGQVVEAANALRNRGYFKGGVGRYGSFTHIDTRGENVSW